MIFVTVGTHEQPFNRLVKKIDELKGNGTIQDDVFIQTGFSTYEPKNCQWSKLIPYYQKIKKVEDEIEKTENLIKSLEEKLFDPEISADSGKVKELYEEKVSLEEKLEELYEKWEEIQ